MAIEPILFLITVLVILAVFLRARKVATGRALSDREPESTGDDLYYG